MQTNTGPFNLASTFLRLGSNASVEPLPVNDSFWQKMQAGQLGSFHHEYLVSNYVFAADWPMWEMHPNGDEVVYLLSGSATFVLQTPDGVKSFELRESGSYVIVPKGTWHTAKVENACSMLFITAGEGTQHRALSDPAE